MPAYGLIKRLHGLEQRPAPTLRHGGPSHHPVHDVEIGQFQQFLDLVQLRIGKRRYGAREITANDRVGLLRAPMGGPVEDSLTSEVGNRLSHWPKQNESSGPAQIWLPADGGMYKLNASPCQPVSPKIFFDGILASA